MESVQKVNVIELASELADLKVSDLGIENNTSYLVEDDEEIRYTEEGQDIFDEWYDRYLTLIETCVEK